MQNHHGHGDQSHVDRDRNRILQIHHGDHGDHRILPDG